MRLSLVSGSPIVMSMKSVRVKCSRCGRMMQWSREGSEETKSEAKRAVYYCMVCAARIGPGTYS